MSRASSPADAVVDAETGSDAETDARAGADGADLAAALRLHSMRLARRLRVERGSDDLTLSQLAVLGTLERHGASTVGELATFERVKPPSMTRIVNGLAEAGLVTRRPHDTDGRQVVIDLADEARTILEEDRRRRTAWLAQRLAELTDDDRALLARVLPLLERLSGS